MPFLRVYFSNGIFISAPCASRAAEAASGSQSFLMAFDKKAFSRSSLQLNPDPQRRRLGRLLEETQNAFTTTDVWPDRTVPAARRPDLFGRAKPILASDISRARVIFGRAKPILRGA